MEGLASKSPGKEGTLSVEARRPRVHRPVPTRLLTSRIASVRMILEVLCSTSNPGCDQVTRKTRVPTAIKAMKTGMDEMRMDGRLPDGFRLTFLNRAGPLGAGLVRCPARTTAVLFCRAVATAAAALAVCEALNRIASANGEGSSITFMAANNLARKKDQEEEEEEEEEKEEEEEEEEEEAEEEEEEEKKEEKLETSKPNLLLNLFASDIRLRRQPCRRQPRPSKNSKGFPSCFPVAGCAAFCAVVGWHARLLVDAQRAPKLRKASEELHELYTTQLPPMTFHVWGVGRSSSPVRPLHAETVRGNRSGSAMPAKASQYQGN
eukprot:GHVT01008587.1.p2 GENE.GHVT01008587.1~~GHVT01008587.1.p2  ORF type:complete len:321 (+),score=84.28 GHVT01008587.1:2172-3134(+)